MAHACPDVSDRDGRVICSSLQPMSLQACTQNGVHLAAGDHIISFPSGSPFLVTGLLAQGTGSGLTALPTGTRSATCPLWTPGRRTVAVSGGSATYLQVSQNYNPGWVATLDGRTVTPVRLDGWQQGWILPAGASGTMVMTFTPDHTYRAALLLGALFLLLLVCLALARNDRSRLEPSPPRRKLRSWVRFCGAAIVGSVSAGGLPCARPALSCGAALGSAVVRSSPAFRSPPPP